MHEKHKGHDAMHAEMVLVLLVTLIVSQILLVLWRTKHLKSFQVSCIPRVIAAYDFNFNFILVCYHVRYVDNTIWHFSSFWPLSIHSNMDNIHSSYWICFSTLNSNTIKEINSPARL